MKVVINTSNFGEHDTTPLEKLKQAKWQYALNPYKRQLTEKEVIELSQDAVGLIAGNEPLNKHVLTNLKAVKVISRCGVGKDNIDLTTAEKLGIKVFCTPNGPTLAVAELTVGLILNLLRKINGMDADVRSGLWKKQMPKAFQDRAPDFRRFREDRAEGRAAFIRLWRRGRLLRHSKDHMRDPVPVDAV